MSQQLQARKEIEAALIAKAQAEPAFRQALLSNGKATIEKELGISLPAGAVWKVVEETATTNYLVLPVAEGESSEADLSAVAGGMNVSMNTSRSGGAKPTSAGKAAAFAKVEIDITAEP